MENFASSVRTFDAFPKVSATYTRRSDSGGVATILLSIFCVFFLWVELGSYISGTTEHQFSVADTVGWDLQVNLDMTVAMPCNTLHVNAQDASGDRMLAAEVLQMEGTTFDSDGAHELSIESRENADDDVDAVFRRARVARKFKATRKARADGPACRIYGSFKVNKVQGDLHITAKGYGYFDGSAGHLPQSALNFSHVISELSFGEYYPRLENPLDGVAALTNENLFRHQYYLSVIPTTYTSHSSRRQIVTNQYAVTEQPRLLSHITRPPGIFFKYDIEPISVSIRETRMPFVQFLLRLVNVMGGLVVCTGWAYPLVEHAYNRMRNRGGERYQRRTMLDKGVTHAE
ncbi:endoplasmic reticulum vesicle transporter-domain-containing protein [Dipodascopsis tothii]|uniref:endoplasmic reticulum vesicle transporter-domain-containing protein n=1 Tax=Dipodascopsis tothii TaxID=44089 RepID=UPI0034CDEF07